MRRRSDFVLYIIFYIIQDGPELYPSITRDYGFPSIVITMWRNRKDSRLKVNSPSFTCMLLSCPNSKFKYKRM